MRESVRHLGTTKTNYDTHQSACADNKNEFTEVRRESQVPVLHARFATN